MVTFAIDGVGPATLSLNATVLGGTGGFFAVPEPTIWLLLVTGFGLVGGELRSRRKLGSAT